MSCINRIIFAVIATILLGGSLFVMKLMPTTDWQAVAFIMTLSIMDAGLLFVLWAALLPAGAFQDDPQDQSIDDL